MFNGAGGSGGQGGGGAMCGSVDCQPGQSCCKNNGQPYCYPSQCLACCMP